MTFPAVRCGIEIAKTKTMTAFFIDMALILNAVADKGIDIKQGILHRHTAVIGAMPHECFGCIFGNALFKADKVTNSLVLFLAEEVEY